MTEQELLDQEKRYTGTTWTRNDLFEEHGYVVIKNLWDPEELYHPDPLEKGQYNYWDNNPEHFTHVPVESQVEGSTSRYWHPQYRAIHSGIRLKLEKIIGRELYNTYYYDRFYFAGQELTRHADRDACEISVSVHISSNIDECWPFCIKNVSGEEISACLEPGDGLLYKGCERPHWRDPLQSRYKRKRDRLKNWITRKEDDTYYHQVFFHYVLADGLRAQCYNDAAR